jgi:hypothetical protein
MMRYRDCAVPRWGLFSSRSGHPRDYPQFTARLTGEYQDLLVNTTVSALKTFDVLRFLIIIPAALILSQCKFDR